MLVNNEVGTSSRSPRWPRWCATPGARRRAPHRRRAGRCRWLDVRRAGRRRPTSSPSAPTSSAGPRASARSWSRDAARRSRPRQLGGGQEREPPQRHPERRRHRRPGRGAAARRRRAGRRRSARVGALPRPPGRRPAARRCPTAPVEHRRPTGAAARRASPTSASPGVESEALLFLLDRGRRLRLGGVVVLASGAQEPSHVLAAMGVDPAPGRRRRCACRSAGRPPTPTSTHAVAAVAAGRRAAAGAGATGRRVRVLVGDVGRRRLVGGRRAPAATQGHDVVGRHAEAVGRRVRHRLLLGGRRRRRPPGRRPARHRPPRLQLRRRLRRATSSSPTSPPTPPGRTPEPVHRVQPPPQVRPPPATGPTPLGFDAVATGHHARIVAAARRHPPAWPGAPTRPRTRATSSTCSTRPTLARIAASRSATLTKAEVRAEAAALGLRTAAKPDSQDVCFITAAEGRAGVPRPIALDLHPGRVVDTGRRARSARSPPSSWSPSASGTGSGCRAAHDPRYAVDVDVAAATVTVGAADDLLVDGDAGRPRGRGRRSRWSGRAAAQTSAHGAPAPVSPSPTARCAGTAPRRRVAPGQLVVVYEGDEVAGSALAR